MYRSIVVIDVTPDPAACGASGAHDDSHLDAIRFCALQRPSGDVVVITLLGNDHNVQSAIEAGEKGCMLGDDTGASPAGAGGMRPPNRRQFHRD